MPGGFRSLLPQLGFWPGGGVSGEGRVLPHGRALHPLGSNSPSCSHSPFCRIPRLPRRRIGVYPSGQRAHYDAPDSPSLGLSLMWCARLEEMAREQASLASEEVER
jgi:hypothetical protein